MKFDDLKSQWSGYSTRKKWTIAGVGMFVCVAAAGAGNERPDRGSARYGAAPDYAGRGDLTAAPGDGGQYAGQGYAAAAPAGGMGGYAGGGVAAAGTATGSDDTMSRWEANERVKDRAAAAFDQNLRDETTVRSTTTGEVVTGVSNPTADAAVDSGAATVVPTSELPVSPDPGE